MENWKPVLGWELFYEISDLGNVRSIQRTGRTNYGERIYGGFAVKSFMTRPGYLAVNLTCKGKRKQFHVHRLVLESFAGLPEVGHECCHNNGIRTDNRLENLRWDTRKNNHLDKKLHGTWQVGEKSGTSKLKNPDVVFIRESNKPYKELAEFFGVSKNTIERIKNNRSWTHI